MRRLFGRHNKVELDLDFIGDQAGVFPLAAADVELQALDRQHAVEYLRAVFRPVADRHHDFAALAFDGQGAGDAVGAGAAGLDLARHERGRRESGAVEPFLAGDNLVVFGCADVEAGDVDIDPGVRRGEIRRIELDLGTHLLELAFNRHVQLLEDDGNAGLRGVGRGVRRRCAGQYQRQRNGAGSSNETWGIHKRFLKKVIASLIGINPSRPPFIFQTAACVSAGAGDPAVHA